MHPFAVGSAPIPMSPYDLVPLRAKQPSVLTGGEQPAVDGLVTRLAKTRIGAGSVVAGAATFTRSNAPTEGDVLPRLMLAVIGPACTVLAAAHARLSASAVVWMFDGGQGEPALAATAASLSAVVVDGSDTVMRSVDAGDGEASESELQLTCKPQRTC
jgi:hypothetical protein